MAFTTDKGHYQPDVEDGVPEFTELGFGKMTPQVLTRGNAHEACRHGSSAERDNLLDCLIRGHRGSSASFAGSGDFGVKQVLCEVPDVLPDRCEGKIPVSEVANS